VSTPALDRLVRALEEEFRGEPRGQRVVELLGEYAGKETDWREFALFSEAAYTRNLVERLERFELMILCWGREQESPIHNHEGQDCWMAVLAGDIEEVRFPWPSGERSPLRARGSLVYGPGQVGFIRDEIGLHLVRPAPVGSEGVTLHLYAAPYDECNCYSPETGAVTRRRLFHHSVRGRLLAPSRQT
jgi:cysteine dioxygenase